MREFPGVTKSLIKNLFEKIADRRIIRKNNIWKTIVFLRKLFKKKRKFLIWKSDTGFFPSASITPELAAVDAVNFSTLFTIATDFRLLRTTSWGGTRMNQARPVRRLGSYRWKGTGGNMKSWRTIQSKPVVEHVLCDSLEKS